MMAMNRLLLRLSSVYMLGIYAWTGYFWATIWAVVISVAYGLVTGYQIAREERDRPLVVLMVVSRSLRRLGGAGLNGFVVALALYGMVAAYPAMFGHPLIHDYAPVDGSLVRASSFVSMWIFGLVVTVAISAYREYADARDHAWDLKADA
jgi:hypothetical protein